jgi:ABC-type polysaccharide/polyol phosphate export permease
MFDYAFSDLKNTLKMFPVALFFARSDLKARYRRSVLGPLWLVLGTAIGVAGLGVLWSVILKVDRAVFIPSLTVGLIVWQFISGTVTESTRVFINNANILRNLKIPFIFYPTQLVMKQLVNFAHNALVIVVVLLIYHPLLGWAQWLLIPGLILLVGNLLWISLIMGMLGARYRDIEQLVNAVVPLLFFLSPVIYRPTQLGIQAKIAWMNPFTYLITVIRDPIQGVAPAPFVYVVSVAMLVLGWLASLWLLQRKYRRVAFWI